MSQTPAGVLTFGLATVAVFGIPALVVLMIVGYMAGKSLFRRSASSALDKRSRWIFLCTAIAVTALGNGAVAVSIFNQRAQDSWLKAIISFIGLPIALGFALSFVVAFLPLIDRFRHETSTGGATICVTAGVYLAELFWPLGLVVILLAGIST